MKYVFKIISIMVPLSLLQSGSTMNHQIRGGNLPIIWYKRIKTLVQYILSIPYHWEPQSWFLCLIQATSFSSDTLEIVSSSEHHNKGLVSIEMCVCACIRFHKKIRMMIKL